MSDVNVAVLQQLTVLLSDSNDFGAAFRSFLKEKRLDDVSIAPTSALDYNSSADVGAIETIVY